MRIFELIGRIHSRVKRWSGRGAKVQLGIAVVISAAILGCGKPAVTQIKGNVPFDEVPAAVLKTARAKDPTVRFNDAIKRADGVYEVNGKNAKGKLIRVEVKESGEFVKFG